MFNTHLRLFWVDFFEYTNATVDINPTLTVSLWVSYIFVVKNYARLELSIKTVGFQKLTFFNLKFPGFKSTDTIYLMVQDFDKFSVFKNLSFGILILCPQIIKLNGSVYSKLYIPIFLLV